tara:strand:- start:261 stop:554 length:294 start_codon:yes stop_codon:yes gene_type:complete
MKINIWIPREDVWEINTLLQTEVDESVNRLVTFFHDKPVKRMDLIQISIDIEEYQKLVDNNEGIQLHIAEGLGWNQTTTSADSLLKYLPPHDYQLGN